MQYLISYLAQLYCVARNVYIMLLEFFLAFPDMYGIVKAIFVYDDYIKLILTIDDKPINFPTSDEIENMSNRSDIQSNVSPKKEQAPRMRCLFFFWRPIRGISPGNARLRRVLLGSHSPLGDRRAACAARQSPGGERANSRQRRDSRVFGCFRAQSARSRSHIPPEDRKATRAARHFPGGERANSRQRRDSRLLSTFRREALHMLPHHTIKSRGFVNFL